MSKSKKTPTDIYFDQFRPLSHSIKKKAKSGEKVTHSTDSPLAKLDDMIVQADHKADEIIDIINEIDVSSSTPFPVGSFTVDVLTMLSLITKIDNKTVDTAIRLLKIRQTDISTRAKRDVLQKIIYELVKRNSALTQRQLILALKDRKQPGAIIEIDDVNEELSFRKNGQEKWVSFVALKDRLSREKKKIKSKAKKL